MNNNEKEKLVWEFKNQRITLDELIELSYNKGGYDKEISDTDNSVWDDGWDEGYKEGQYNPHCN